MTHDMRTRLHLFVILALLVHLSCATLQPGAPALSTERVPSLLDIATPQTAKRALIIVQELRISALRALAEKHRGDIDMLARIEAADRPVRLYWDLALQAAKTWETLGDRGLFDRQYRSLEAELATLGVR